MMLVKTEVIGAWIRCRTMQNSIAGPKIFKTTLHQVLRRILLGDGRRGGYYRQYHESESCHIRTHPPVLKEKSTDPIKGYFYSFLNVQSQDCLCDRSAIDKTKQQCIICFTVIFTELRYSDIIMRLLFCFYVLLYMGLSVIVKH